MIEYLSDSQLSQPLIFDSHAHYYDAKFDGVRDEILSCLPSHGVCGVINCGCDIPTSDAVLALAEKYPYCYSAVGYHPENLDGEIDLAEIERLAHEKSVVAIGEIGLDYNWNSENKPFQREIFEKQLMLANRLELPVIVHDRDAHANTLELLKKHRPRGVVHCFSGSEESAREILSLGMYLGVGGVITFKNSKRLPEVVRMIPDNRLLLETDCPYLAPEPYRGKLCHSGMIALVAETIAGIRGGTRDDILNLCAANTRTLFGIQ